MGDYIDRQATIDYIEENKCRLGITNCNAWNFKDILRAQPAADVAPVVHGKWVICSDGYYPYCSNCREEPKGGTSKFCPNCGAKMDKEATP